MVGLQPIFFWNPGRLTRSMRFSPFHNLFSIALSRIRFYQRAIRPAHNTHIKRVSIARAVDFSGDIPG
jgi:hypothetical protein